jgi:16S rRNA (guanine527-N7)-methyltransferase
MQAESFAQAARTLGLLLTQEQLGQFEAFEEALYRANEVMNLTRVQKEECWIRHFVDSLLFQDLVPLNSSVLDIGTGPGLPAWPLACARPDLSITAMDSSGKMLGFLRSQPLPNLNIIQSRAEEWMVREEFDVVTGRAVAPLPVQLEISAAFAKVEGSVIPMRTPAERSEANKFAASQLGLKLEASDERGLPGTDIRRLFLTFRKVEKTPPRFPRAWSEIKRKPLL